MYHYFNASRKEIVLVVKTAMRKRPNVYRPRTFKRTVLAAEACITMEQVFNVITISLIANMIDQSESAKQLAREIYTIANKYEV